MSEDLISRQAVLDKAYELDLSDTGNDIRVWVVDVAEIEKLPAAKPRKGKWEVCNILDYAQRPSGRKILRCPFCGYLTGEFRSMVDYYHKLTHFCPNCGAEMEGGERSKHG